MLLNLTLLIFGSVVFTLVNAASLGSTYRVKDKHHVPQGWKRIGPPPPGTNFTLRIALRHADIEALEKRLLDVSDPQSQRYGQHLSAAEVHALAEPSESTQGAVRTWLEGHGHAGIVEHSPAKDWVKLRVHVSDAEKLLNTTYHLYRHEDGSELIRAIEWSIPANLHDHVDTIQPTNSFVRFQPQAMHRMANPLPQKGYPNELVGAGAIAAKGLAQDEIFEVCNAAAVTPQCLRRLYGIEGYTPRTKPPRKQYASPRNKMAYCNYMGETTLKSDLKMFLERFRPEAKDAIIDFSLANGAENRQKMTKDAIKHMLHTEGNLDGQTIVGLAWPLPVVAYNTGARPGVKDAYLPKDRELSVNEPLLDWLDHMSTVSDEELPTTVSTSYGEPEYSVPKEYALRACRSLAALGLRGVTLLFSSGDLGVGKPNAGKNKCKIYPNHGNTRDAYENFIPNFPASCSFVTAVGATRGIGSRNFNMEVAAGHPKGFVNDFFASGGGFSNYFPRPAWQDSAVTNYTESLEREEVNPDMYNHDGRAYPDLAANGQSYNFVWNKQFLLVDGTSASTPTMAVVVGFMNDFLIASGRPPLGFMNPWLYSVGHVGFTDIISGSAKGCGVAGFPAKPGWDAVTGFGTPNFPELLKILEESSIEANATIRPMVEVTVTSSTPALSTKASSLASSSIKAPKDTNTMDRPLEWALV